MSWPSALFALHCVVILGAAIVGLISRSGTQTSAAWFLLSMSSLAGVFVLLEAHVIAIAQLFFCGGLGLVCLFAIDESDDDDSRDSQQAGEKSESWHWLIVMFGVAGASLMLTALIRVVPGNLADAPRTSSLASTSSFETVGYAVLVDQGMALLCIGLLLFGALIGVGYLTRRGLD